MDNSRRLVGVLKRLGQEYGRTTPTRVKLVDAYLLYVVLTGVLQFAYVVVAGTFPFNSFLSAFCSSAATFVLTANLRLQMESSPGEISIEGAFAEYIFASLVLHFFVINFLG